jgi:hypothetical protein
MCLFVEQTIEWKNGPNFYYRKQKQIKLLPVPRNRGAQRQKWAGGCLNRWEQPPCRAAAGISTSCMLNMTQSPHSLAVSGGGLGQWRWPASSGGGRAASARCLGWWTVSWEDSTEGAGEETFLATCNTDPWADRRRQ